MPRGPRPSSISTLPPKAGQVLAILALEIAGTQSAAAELVGESQASWSRLASGERLLTEQQLGDSLTKLGVGRDDFERRLTCYAPQSLPKARIRWLVPPKRGSGQLLGIDDVFRLAGVTMDALMLPCRDVGPMRGANLQDGRALAQRVRSAWGLGAYAPVADLSLTFGSRAVLLLPADVVVAGAGWLKSKKGKREVIVVPQSLSALEQRWGASRMFACLRRRTVLMPDDAFLQDFAREFLIPQASVEILLRPLVKLPNQQLMAGVVATLWSQHFGAPFEETAKILADNLKLSKLPEPVPAESNPEAPNAWLTILRAADFGANSGASGSH